MKWNFWLWLAAQTHNEFWIAFGLSPVKTTVYSIVMKLERVWPYWLHGLFQRLQNWSTGRGWREWLD